MLAPQKNWLASAELWAVTVLESAKSSSRRCMRGQSFYQEGLVQVCPSLTVSSTVCGSESHLSRGESSHGSKGRVGKHAPNCTPWNREGQIPAHTAKIWVCNKQTRLIDVLFYEADKFYLMYKVYLIHIHTYIFAVVKSLSCVWLLFNAMDCSLSGSSVHGISQAWMLEQVVISFLYIYIYIYTHTHTHAYTHTYMHIQTHIYAYIYILFVILPILPNIASPLAT